MPDKDASTPTVLLVGHCGFDSGGLRRAVESASPGVRVESVNDSGELDRELEAGADLLLVNRVLDGAFGATSSGVELIRGLTASGEGHGRRVATMLVSNFAQAQEEAEAAGALAGFGKDDLGTGAAAERIRSALVVGSG